MKGYVVVERSLLWQSKPRVEGSLEPDIPIGPNLLNRNGPTGIPRVLQVDLKEREIPYRDRKQIR